MFKRLMVISLLASSSLADPATPINLIHTAKPIVRISLPRVLEVMGQIQEGERENELPGTLLFDTLDDRLEKLMGQLKGFLKQYEAEEGVRIDISALEEDILDYT